MKKLLFLILLFPLFCNATLTTKNLDNQWHSVNVYETFCATVESTERPFDNVVLQCEYKTTMQNNMEYVYDFRSDGNVIKVAPGDFKPVVFYENNHSKTASICSKWDTMECNGFTCPTFFIKCKIIEAPKNNIH